MSDVSKYVQFIGSDKDPLTRLVKEERMSDREHFIHHIMKNDDHLEHATKASKQGDHTKAQHHMNIADQHLETAERIHGKMVNSFEGGSHTNGKRMSADEIGKHYDNHK